MSYVVYAYGLSYLRAQNLRNLIVPIFFNKIKRILFVFFYLKNNFGTSEHLFSSYKNLRRDEYFSVFLEEKFRELRVSLKNLGSPECFFLLQKNLGRS